MADFTGTWKNQLESKLELNVLNGVVTGRFESGKGDNNQTLWVPVSGRALGDLITFNAVYEKYQTVVTWLGQHTVEHGRGAIKTMWLHATNVEEKKEEEWMWFANRVGADVFERV